MSIPSASLVNPQEQYQNQNQDDHEQEEEEDEDEDDAMFSEDEEDPLYEPALVSPRRKPSMVVSDPNGTSKQRQLLASGARKASSVTPQTSTATTTTITTTTSQKVPTVVSSITTRNKGHQRGKSVDSSTASDSHNHQTISQSHNRNPSHSNTDEHFCMAINPVTKEPCMKKFSRPYDLIRHQNTIHASKKKIFRCLICIQELGSEGYQRTFSRNDALSRHVKVKHNLQGSEAQRVIQYAKDNVEYQTS